jgi:hypothetical protein
LKKNIKTLEAPQDFFKKKSEVSISKMWCLPFIYLGEKGRTLGKAYGVVLLGTHCELGECQWEH